MNVALFAPPDWPVLGILLGARLLCRTPDDHALSYRVRVLLIRGSPSRLSRRLWGAIRSNEDSTSSTPFRQDARRQRRTVPGGRSPGPLYVSAHLLYA